MEIYQHFRKEEQPIIDQALSWKEQVERSYRLKLTDFLDPREQQIIRMLIGTSSDELVLKFHGGGVHTERKRAIIAPQYEAIDVDNFELVLLQASYPSKFITLTHRDVLGAFLSLGIKRKKLGDILLQDGLLQIVIAADIAPYVSANLTGIKKASIVLEEKPLAALIEQTHHWEERNHTVASLRLDAVLKEIYHISRKDAASYITKNLVKVNYMSVDDTAFIVQKGDLFSVRGKGRSKLIAIDGKTKKNKWKITTGILK